MSVTMRHPKPASTPATNNATNLNKAGHPAATMTAIVQRSYGGAETLEVATIDRPTPSADQVLLEVRAAGLDRGTWHLMAGLPYVVRLGFGLTRPKHPVPGLDVAGVVVGVGANVTRFAVGDEVLGVANGSFAEYATADQHKLTKKPATLSWEAAGVTAISGMTAYQALEGAGVTSGQRVLVIGASGGVGSYAVQIAKSLGAVVSGVASAEKLDLVRALGADDVIDYRTTALSDIARTWDVIIDIAGNTKLSTLRGLLTENGTLAIVGGENGGKLIGGIQRSVGAAMLSPFVGHDLNMVFSKEHSDHIDPLLELIERGDVVPAIDHVVPLDEVPAAMQALVDGTVRGKIAVSVSAA